MAQQGCNAAVLAALESAILLLFNQTNSIQRLGSNVSPTPTSDRYWSTKMNIGIHLKLKIKNLKTAFKNLKNFYSNPDIGSIHGTSSTNSKKKKKKKKLKV